MQSCSRRPAPGPVGTESPDVVFLAALLGIAGAVVSRTRGDAMSWVTALPFGPCLAIALWIVRLHGPLIFGRVSVGDRI
jgi:prepilin signal peptidase PulO-like enzyme (type II secretory pathway)